MIKGEVMALPDGAPAKSAKHSDWVEYAISQGAASFEAGAMTKDELVAKYETPDPKPSKAPSVNPQDVGPGHGSLWDETWGGKRG